MKIIKRAFNYIERTIRKHRLNVFATIYLNFRTLPFHIAIKFPIYVYGKARFLCLSGSVRFETDYIHRGMVKIGRHDDYFAHKAPTVIYIEKFATLIFKGYVSISNGNIIRISDKGILIFDHFAQTGNHVTFDCSNYISIGKLCGISYNTILCDSNHHYSINLANNKITNCKGKIILGERTFIGNNSIILKGCKTSKDSLICSKSLAFMNYSSTKAAVIMGNPAEIINENFTRIWSFTRENEVSSFFNENPSKNSMSWSGEFIDCIEDLIKFYK